MAELPRAPSNRKYSWWWDSHISPKNSKWLLENLSDMDSKVKAMIKLIEEDADSFARKAEMYYEKRPELMKLVEEFYRAYRALAERYDNATGVLRQAQRTISEALPNQDPLGISDDPPKNSQKSRNFHENLSGSEVVSNFEMENQALKDALAQLELEKEAGIIEYENILEKLSKLGEVSRELNDRANRAEGEVQVLRVSLTQLEAKKEDTLLEYEKYLVKIVNLEDNLSEKDEALDRYKQSSEMVSNLENKLLKLVEEDARQLRELADKTEREVETLKQELAKLTEENKSFILQYNKCLEKVSVLENELSCAEDEVQRLKECNLSSSMTIKEMQKDTFGLGESKKRLAEEVEIQMDQKIQLQTENSNLKEISEKQKTENLLLLKKLAAMEELIDKNSLLEKSLSDLTVELEGERGKISSLLEEKSAILADKADLTSQLQAMVANLEKISENNSFLEESRQSLEKEKFYLIDQKDALASQEETIQQTLEVLGKGQMELEERYSSLEKERKSTFSVLEKLGFFLDVEKKENATFAQRTESQLAGMGGQIGLLQEEVFFRKREFEEELDKVMNYQIEIFVLKRCMEDLKDKNSSILAECQKLETVDKELKIKNEMLILSQNEANKLLELNRDLYLKVNELASTKRENDEVNLAITNRDNQIHKLSDDNVTLTKENLCLHKQIMELDVKLKNEDRFYEPKERVTLKDAKIELLEKPISSLNGENGRLETQLAAYSSLIMSLKDSISSLESRTLSTKLQKSHNEGAKKKNDNADEKVFDPYSELKNMQFMIKVIERAIVQKEKIVAKENLGTNTYLEAAKKSIDGLKIKNCVNKAYSVPMYDNSEFDGEITMKDIMLDKNSETSSYELSRRLVRKSRSKRVESWDSSDLDLSIDLTIGRDESVKSHKSKYRSSFIEAEKELGVDKLEISRTFSQRSQEANKSKILERLDSDAKKLNNLQMTVQDLMKNGDITLKGKHDTLRDQLEEAEEAIMELSDFNGKLMRSVEKRSFSSNVTLGADSDESGMVRRRKISEQARKMSEKIGRWQTEVQKIQNSLLKKNQTNEKEIKGKSRVTEIRRRVLLRDYIYGALRTPSRELRKKKSSFCGCAQPPTRED